MPRGVYERKPRVPAGPTRLWVGVPEAGVELKMIVGTAANPSHVIGTLRITRQGLIYVRSNGKKRPDRQVTWPVLERLMALGIA